MTWTLGYNYDDAKLEGLAVVDDELWLAFDGMEPHLERRKLVDVYAELRE